MAVPASRHDFKEYCLRKLGKPVIKINVDDDQVEDRIDESLRLYWDYHFDGSQRTYYKHQITDQDKLNKYITLPENIMGAVRIFPIGDPIVRSDDLFNIRYQIALNDLYSLTSVSMVPYYMVMEHLALVSELLVGQQPIRFNRHRNQLWIDMDWDKMRSGEYLLVEAHEVINPETFADVWADRWLQNYVTAKIQFQWGANLSKFSNMQLTAGVTFNGLQLKEEAQEQILRLEQELKSSYMSPGFDMMVG